MWACASRRRFAEAGAAGPSAEQPAWPEWLRSTGSDRRFDGLDLHPHSLRALQEVFRYEEMTVIQAHVLPKLLSVATAGAGGGAVVHARTGTGKTLIYLVPAVEAILRRSPPGVGAVVVAPSRELALQITKEADRLCSYHALQVVPLVGGVRRDQDVAVIRRRRPAIIVCTPGKLVEHLEGTFRFQTLFEAVGTLVFDECDSLLDAHGEAVRELLSYMPANSARQSVLVSATMPPDVRDLAARACGPDYELFDCVGPGAPTRDEVKQYYVTCPGLLTLTVLKNAISEEMAANPTRHKIIVFFPTARLAAFASELFRGQFKMHVYEIHARREASARMVAQQEFNECASGILFTSRVSERGMDYPDISLVVQLLAPDGLEQYVHRVGRTARSGKEGVSLLILLDREERAGLAGCLSGLPLQRHPLEGQLLNDAGALLAEKMSSAAWSSRGALHAAASGAFVSLLQHFRRDRRQSSVPPRVLERGVPDGTATSAVPGAHLAENVASAEQHGAALDADDTVEAASELLLGCGLDEPPPVSASLAESLGLEGCVASGLLRVFDEATGEGAPRRARRARDGAHSRSLHVRPSDKHLLGADPLRRAPLRRFASRPTSLAS